MPHIAILQNSSKSGDQLSGRYEKALNSLGVSSEIILLTMSEEEILERLERCDGIILTGADTNVCPSLYVKLSNGETIGDGYHDRVRDRQAFLLIKIAYEQKIPLLAICRGFQEMNVYFGGGLTDIKHIDREVKHDFGYRYPDQREEYAHDITVEKGGLFESIFTGKKILRVNSVHRQGVQASQKAPDLHLESICDEGLFIEALSHPNHPFFLGVQFHPEFKIGLPVYRHIFDRFLASAKG